MTSLKLISLRNGNPILTRPSPHIVGYPVCVTRRGVTTRNVSLLFRSLRYEKVCLPLHKVADTPFHIHGDDLLVQSQYEKTKHKLFFFNLSTICLLKDIIIIT